jgi:peptidoglycan/xylan/chitin deacetylase (PgdA/CDA1 family)
MRKLRNERLFSLIVSIFFILLFGVLTKTINAANSKFPVESKKNLFIKSPNVMEDSTNITANQIQVAPLSEFTKQINDDLCHHNKVKSNAKLSSSVNVNLKSIRVPVLMYHSINTNSSNNLIITLREFEKQVKWLKENQFTSLSLPELFSILTTGKNVPLKPIVLTFDDGYEDNYTKAYPILKKYNFKATIFLITNTIGQPSRLKENQIREMYANNIDFQSHTVSHNELNRLSYKKQLEELICSKETISKLLNKKTDYLCYPVGKYNEDTIKALKEAGYKMAFTTKHGYAKLSDGLYTIKRVRMWPGINMRVFINDAKKK